VAEASLDKWQIELVKIKGELQTCQKTMSVESCSKCKKFTDCELRDAYVKAVYDSMSKGEGGGFEF